MRLPLHRRLLLFGLLISLTLAHRSNGQTVVWSIEYMCDDSADAAACAILEDRFKGDSASCIRHLEKSLNRLRASGYLEASIDTLTWIESTLTAITHIGKRYEEIRLSNGNVPKDLIPRALRRGKTFTANEAAGLLEEVVSNCEENGFPFATARLDDIRSEPKGLSAIIVVDTGQLAKIDSVRIFGPEVVAPVFLHDYLGIRPGDLYRESLVRKVDIRLRELPFLSPVRPSGVLFTEKYNRLDLFLDRRKASQFDGVIGLLQDDQGGKPLLTGEVHLRLQNSFRRGEILEFDWRQLPPRSQDLKVRISYPFLFNSPIGLDAALKLYRRDTVFVDVDRNIGMVMALTGNNWLKVLLNRKSSDLQSTAGLESVTVLPDYADVAVTGYGAGLQFEDLDYRLNPRSGYRIEFTGSVGKREIRRNTGINPAAYEGVQLNSTQYQGALDMRYFLPLSNRSVAAFMSKSAFIGGNTLFSNELYRIGGLRSLRGFDEESIFASAYTIATAEYRFITEQNSYLFGFFNAARYQNSSQGASLSGTPWGFGAGYTFQTRLGILSISYALGKQGGDPLLVRSGKVHFGVINYF